MGQDSFISYSSDEEWDVLLSSRIGKINKSKTTKEKIKLEEELETDKIKIKSEFREIFQLKSIVRSYELNNHLTSLKREDNLQNKAKIECEIVKNTEQFDVKNEKSTEYKEEIKAKTEYEEESSDEEWIEALNKLNISSAVKKFVMDTNKSKKELPKNFKKVIIKSKQKFDTEKSSISQTPTQYGTIKSKLNENPNWEKMILPDAIDLFRKFDKDYFKSELSRAGVMIKWSGKMTRAAGLCEFRKKSLQCTIKLSRPLLKLRPFKDTIETLLHEMIHAYLFLRSEDDGSSHGSLFRLHMERINRVAGTKITIYHSFHSEVNKFQSKHVWRCMGICRSASPRYGVFKRSINRAPGPHEFWWRKHQDECGGDFVKLPPDNPFSQIA